MKKVTNHTKTITLIWILTLIFAHTLAAAPPLPTADITSAVGSPNTAPAAPVLYCHDDDPSSLWGFTPGSTDAWVEFSLVSMGSCTRDSPFARWLTSRLSAGALPTA